MATVLVVDDEHSIVWAFERFITAMGHRFLSAATAERGLEIARREKPDLIVMDVKLPGMDGLAALERLREADPGARVIVITAHGSLDTALRATRLGAIEYLAKPMDLVRARQLVESSLGERPPSREIENLRKEAGALRGIIGTCPSLQEAFRTAAAACDSDATVLLVGESGTGKELFARAIHANGRRQKGPLETINCSSIPETLLESELYGHERGAFTGAVTRKEGRFEIAGGGTAFLDEIGELPSSAQVKLLRFLEDRSFSRVGGTEPLSADVRIIAATNRNLEQRVREGKFREDLYFRINVVRLELPPLRERAGDIPLLVAHFVQQSGATGVSDAALSVLKAWTWPGNVRELRNAIERGAVLARGQPIRPEHLPESILRPSPLTGDDLPARISRIVDELCTTGPEGDLLRHVQKAWEKELIARVLRSVDGNQVRASARLGINRMTLRKKIAEFGL